MVKKLVIALVLSISLALVMVVPAAAQDNKPITPPEIKEITFIHYAQLDSPGKPDRPPGQAKKDKEPPPVENNYYDLLGLYLPKTFSIQVNPAGGPGPEEVLLDEIRQAFETWDGVVTTELFGDEVEITTASGLALDGQNTVSWVRIAPPKIIAMVRMWYNDVEGTPDPIIEFDIVLNAFLQWGIDPDDEGPITIEAFDVQNIMTHEIGHPVGLDDLYEEEYRELTMYGYSSKGETQKISLEEGDINGALAIYP